MTLHTVYLWCLLKKLMMIEKMVEYDTFYDNFPYHLVHTNYLQNQLALIPNTFAIYNSTYLLAWNAILDYPQSLTKGLWGGGIALGRVLKIKVLPSNILSPRCSFP
ncbi:hypothetical protein CEXT_734001 [Caerostris extrusa]|uniref:Uncharacterized protein n=1 Tax=Caerostris extrusa TaxID=172846 RepID=A0AAV4XG78_CAEEX|nr:hypothetical protein CEXT_734001 [Caerostris extrusa]